MNPQGFSGVYRHKLGDGSALRASGLFFIVDEDAVGPESTMTGGQIGYDTGATAMTALVPAARIGVAVLANATATDPDPIFEIVMRLLMEAPTL